MHTALVHVEAVAGPVGLAAGGAGKARQGQVGFNVVPRVLPGRAVLAANLARKEAVGISQQIFVNQNIKI